MVTNLSKVQHPTPEIQRKEYQDVNQSVTMQNGETWYILDSEWFHRFKQFIGLENSEDIICPPGPIDNSNILDEQGDLKKGLLEPDDYVIIHESMWKLLHSWYGIAQGQSPIARKVIPNGVFSHNSYMVEIHPVELKISTDKDETNIVKHKFSKSDSISKIAAFARDHFKISNDVKIRLATDFKEGDSQMTFSKRVISDTSSVGDEGLYDGQLVFVEILDNTLKTNGTGTEVVVSQPSTSYRTRDQSNVKSRSRTPGLCGLANLGNTCFMNSVLQCMSNCPPITQYFLNDHHLKELNETNPLGMKGQVAKAFGVLIKTMWSGECLYTAPNAFKCQVSTFASQFSGYQQHDAQELLTFLLDGLHEDLNRVKNKPYIELKDADDRPLDVIAKESWDNYLKRNDSIIVDNFHGLLKSHVTCPHCECVSTTFDPFCYLSLPLPTKKNSSIQIKYIPYDQNKREVVYKLCAARNSVVRDICVDLIDNAKLDVSVDQLAVVKVARSHIHKCFSLDDTIDDVSERDFLHVYDLPISNKNKEYSIIPVCIWEVSEKNQLVDDPILVAFPRRELTYGEIFETVCTQMSRHFNIPGRNDSMEDEFSFTPDSQYVSIHRVNVNERDQEKLCPNSMYSLNEKNKFLAVQIDSSILKQYHKEVNVLQQDFTEQRSQLKHSLDDCLDLFVTNEKLGSEDAWYCPRCKEFQRATKKFDLWSVPKILIIHLKRFHYSRYRRDKIETLVDFPICDLDINKIVINKATQIRKYNLIGVCNHYGTLGGGHYTAFCKNSFDNNWYSFDDSLVQKTSESEVPSPYAYVLMYMQQGQ